MAIPPMIVVLGLILRSEPELFVIVQIAVAEVRLTTLIVVPVGKTAPVGVEASAALPLTNAVPESAALIDASMLIGAVGATPKPISQFPFIRMLDTLI
jgi:hypothetical protein